MSGEASAQCLALDGFKRQLIFYYYCCWDLCFMRKRWRVTEQLGEWNLESVAETAGLRVLNERTVYTGLTD